jgi:hypothetical protein
MSKRRRIVLLIACPIAVAVLLWLLRPSREPFYEGRSLSQWLTMYRFAAVEKAPSKDREMAAEAVRSIGTNALPLLLEWIRYEPRPWRQTVQRMIDKIGANAFPRFADRIPDPFERPLNAKEGFRILGIEARSALPVLLKVASNTNAPLAATIAFESIAYLGSDAVPEVVTALSEKSHPNYNHATWTACWMGYLGSNAAPMIPFLATRTKDTNSETALGAVIALGGFRLAPEISVPALAASLKHNEGVVRASAAESLSRFRAAALPAVPALIAAQTDPDSIVRTAAKDALAGIAPEVLTNAPPR